jgi:diguanylate cyclase (GGDEF)-like protein/PAS domain S-box-containing protein
MPRHPFTLLDDLEAETDLLKKMIAICPDCIIAVDRSGTITLFNQAAEVLTGRKAGDAIDRLSITEIYGSETLARKIKKMIHSRESGGPGRLIDFETEVIGTDSRRIPIRLSAVLLMKNGMEIGSVGYFHDMTERKKMEDRLRVLSETDGLTGLYNQRYFHLRLSGELDRAARYGRPLSLICFDLDQFKICNDQMGHLEGDNVLRLVGELLRGLIRQADWAFRYGGDEFFVILTETPLPRARDAAERIRREFNSRWPYETGAGGGGRVTLSLGVAQAAPDETPRLLIKRADMAMYEAKGAGGDRVAVAAAGIAAKI